MRYVTLAVLWGPCVALGLSVVIAAPGGALESPYHPANLLPIVWKSVSAVLVALGLGVGLGLLLARLGDAVESFDPNEPPALLRISTRWRRTLRSHVSDLVDRSIGAYRVGTRSHSPTHSRSR